MVSGSELRKTWHLVAHLHRGKECICGLKKELIPQQGIPQLYREEEQYCVAMNDVRTYGRGH